MFANIILIISVHFEWMKKIALAINIEYFNEFKIGLAWERWINEGITNRTEMKIDDKFNQQMSRVALFHSYIQFTRRNLRSETEVISKIETFFQFDKINISENVCRMDL